MLLSVAKFYWSSGGGKNESETANASNGESYIQLIPYDTNLSNSRHNQSTGYPAQIEKAMKGPTANERRNILCIINVLKETPWEPPVSSRVHVRDLALPQSSICARLPFLCPRVPNCVRDERMEAGERQIGVTSSRKKIQF